MPDAFVVPDDLFARCVGKIELVQSVLSAFVRQVDEDIPQLIKNLESGDFEAAEKTAHRIKGASANVAAEDICETAGRIETFAREQQPAEVAVEVEQLKDEWKQYVQQTASFISGAVGS